MWKTSFYVSPCHSEEPGDEESVVTPTQSPLMLSLSKYDAVEPPASPPKMGETQVGVKSPSCHSEERSDEESIARFGVGKITLHLRLAFSNGFSSP